MNNFKSKIKNSILVVLAITFIAMPATSISMIAVGDSFSVGVNANFRPTAVESKNLSFVYISDYPYLSEKSYASKDLEYKTDGNITIDGADPKLMGDGMITLTNGKDSNGLPTSKKYLKGITAVADSEVVYDISSFDYECFSVYYGIDHAMSFAEYFSDGGPGSGQAKFYIYTSTDGDSWNLETEDNPAFKKGEDVQSFVTIDIKGKNYLKLKAERGATEYSNHAVWANPRLHNKDFVIDDGDYDFIKQVEYYDEIIKSSTYDEMLTEKEHDLLMRKFVSFFGYDKLQSFAHVDEAHKEFMHWITVEDVDALRYLTTSGYSEHYDIRVDTERLKNKQLDVLYRVYTAHKEDLNDKTQTQYTVLGDLYKRMMITLSFTHQRDIIFVLNKDAPGNPPSDPVLRYEIYKKLHANGYLKNEIFERLTVPEMMLVLNIEMRDDELEWLNWYVRVKMKGNMSCHAYMPYRGPGIRAEFYYADKYATWNNKYNLSGFNLSYGKKDETRLWMVFEQGGWCGTISANGVFVQQIMGVPAELISQPGHAAYIYQGRTADGTPYWNTFYDIFGVANSALHMGENSGLLKWGRKWWNDTEAKNSSDEKVTQSSGSIEYHYCALDAVSDYENFVKAEKMRIISDVYLTRFPTGEDSETYTATGENAQNAEKLKEIFREVLNYSPNHIYGWYGLINAYKEDINTTVEEYWNLAKDIMDGMYEHPFPMRDLLILIEPKIKGSPYYLTYLKYLDEAYKKGKQLGLTVETDYVQPNITRLIANKLSGGAQQQLTVATFSFDGTNANKIMLGSSFVNSGVAWDYSLDGGRTWSSRIDGASVALTADQVNSITQENGIKVHLNGVNYSEENIYTIGIVKASINQDTLYGNDKENKVIGVNDKYQWRYSSSEAWVSYGVRLPDLTGNKSVEVRIGPNGNSLASDPMSFSFTTDTDSDSKKYVSISRLTLHSVSSQATSQAQAGHAANAIDGNYNTRWHSNWNGSDISRYISFKLDKPTFVTGVEFIPAGGGNGKILDGTIYGSLDGISWVKLAERKNLKYSNQCNTIKDALANAQMFDIAQPQDVLYIKIVADRASNGNWFAARGFNIYEDTTQKHRPTASIIYSTTQPTADNVTITLNNLFPDEHITITNNGGSDTYTFTQNGEFTFTFVNDEGVEGSTTAIVTWIDRQAPTAEFEFSTQEPTNDTVTAILKPSEEIVVTSRKFINKNGEIVEMAVKYAVDDKGNVIDLSIESPDEAIMVGHSVDENGYVIDPDGNIVGDTNPLRLQLEDNGELKIEFTDLAGNNGTATYIINWIDKEPPTAQLEYNINQKDIAVVKVVNPSEELVFGKNNGIFVFTQNGEYNIDIFDKAGNKTILKVTVDWLVKDALKSDVVFDITDGTVKATLKFNRSDVTILNNEGKNYYLFSDNGEFTFQYQDGSGEYYEKTVYVDWLEDETSIPSFNVEYDNTITNKDSSVLLNYDKSKYTLLNNNGSETLVFTQNGEYMFELADEDGRVFGVKVVVDWIDKTAPTASLEYDKTQSGKAIVKVINPSEYITFADGNGVYEFTENGEYVIEFYDKAGNKSSLTAVVDWLDGGKKAEGTNTTIIVVVAIVAALLTVSVSSVIVIKVVRKKRS